MSGVTWIKLSVGMFEDEKIRLIRKMPEGNAILIVWVYLLVLAGKCNERGRIYLAEDIAYTDEMLSAIMDIPLNIIRVALNTFQQMKMIEISEDDVIYIRNWEKHQNVEGLDRIREQTRKRVARHRERKKLTDSADSEGNVTCNVTVTQGNAIDIDLDQNRSRKDIDKDHHHDDIASVYKTFENIFPGGLSSYIKQQLDSYVDDGMSPGVIIDALERTGTRGAQFAYCRTILNNWMDKGIKTMEQVKAADAEHERTKRQQDARAAYAEPKKDPIVIEYTPEELEELECLRAEVNKSVVGLSEKMSIGGDDA